MQIQDKVIIVTGASAGIGLSTAKLLASKGAKVALAARSLDKIKDLEKELPNSFAIQTDMTDPSSIKNMINEVKKKYGRIDVLVNNAGQGFYGALESVDIEKYKEVFQLNVIGPLIAMQTVIPIMKAQGSGTIVNISSMVSKNYFPYLGTYSSTKFALNSLTMTARQELAKDNIIVSLMHPGLTSTDFGKNSVKNEGAELRLNRPNMPQADTPEMVTEKIVESIESGKPETFMNEQSETLAKNSPQVK